MTVTNALAYCDAELITATKRFILMALGDFPIDKFWSKFTHPLAREKLIIQNGLTYKQIMSKFTQTITQTSGACTIKLFTAVILVISCCLSLVSLSSRVYCLRVRRKPTRVKNLSSAPL
jgi:hypothetical protein